MTGFVTDRRELAFLLAFVASAAFGLGFLGGRLYARGQPSALHCVTEHTRDVRTGTCSIRHYPAGDAASVPQD